MTIEQTWNNGSYLAGLQGVTIPNTTPSFNEDPRRGRHWSSDNAIQADDDSLKDIFASLNAMPTVQQQDVQVPDSQPAAVRQAQDEAQTQVQSPVAQQPYDFPEPPERQQVDAEQLRFSADVDSTEHTPIIEEHGPIQQIDSNPPAFVPGSTHSHSIRMRRRPPLSRICRQPSTIFRRRRRIRLRNPNLGYVGRSRRPCRSPTSWYPKPMDADEDTVPKERMIKAQQVEQLLRAEHPEADDEFVSAIRQLVELNASDLHLVINDPPMLRVDGKLRPAKGLSVWTKERTYAAVKVMTNDLELERFKEDLELDISFAIGDLLRFRVNVYRDRMGVCAALRTIPTEIKTAQELGLDPRIADLAMLLRGLVLVCGPTGSGKSTTLAAIVDKANAERADHIITIEDPIEFVHQHKRCVMSQREVGTDTKSFAEALKRALREDPDIIEVGELRDLETISIALTAVETGHLVFATLHTQDAGSTVDRLIDVYPENQQQQIRVQVASTLRAVIVQTLIPRASGHGRAPATEVMINNPAVAALIRSGKAHQIRTVLQSGEKEGMHTLDQDLARLVNMGVITFEDALVKVQVREEFEKLCGARKSF